MNTEHLNIGLNRTDEKTMNASDVAYLIAAKLPWLRFTTSGPFASQTEPTVVVTLRDPVNDATITELCELLAQDCIARFSAETGDAALVGPKAAEWGEFDPARFIMPSGHTLPEHRVREAAPDLLAALKDLLGDTPRNNAAGECNHCGRDNSDYRDDPCSDDCPGEIARAAIAKAEGRASTKAGYRFTPETCPSKHWNDGHDTCADCGADCEDDDFVR